MEDANDFLESYIYAFNSEFAVEPKDKESLFRAPDDEPLDTILCVRERRKLDNGGVFSYKNKLFKVMETMDTGCVPPKAFVEVLIYDRHGMRVLYNKTIFEVLPYFKPKKKKSEKTVDGRSPGHPVSDDHCFKHGASKYNAMDSYLTDQEILNMLDEVLFGKIYAQRRAAL